MSAPSASPAAPTPEPGPPPQTTQRVDPNVGEIAGAIVLSVFYAVLLVYIAFRFRKETASARLTQEKKTIEEMEAERDAAGEVVNTDWETKPLRFDEKDETATGTARFKNWATFLQTGWVQHELDSAPAQDKGARMEALKREFRCLPTKEEQEEVDKWALSEVVDTGTPWEDLTGMEKVETVAVGSLKFCGIWVVLYLFIIALGLMGNSFKVLGGRQSGRTFRESELFDNPIAGLTIGMLITVMLQSSSTTTSIIISMSASGLIEVQNAAFMIMGANIGTSVTNTIVSVFHVHNPIEYRRAFTGATFHDMFNWCSVFVFLPLEACTGFLVNMAGAAVDSMDIDTEEQGEKVELLKKITKPASGRIISVDKKLITKIAEAEDDEKLKELEAMTIIKQKSGHVFRDTPVTDTEAGGILLFVSLIMLCVCLLVLVMLLQSVLKGQVAVWLKKLLNLEFDNCVCRQFGGLDMYILLVFGCGCTILVQSSSVFTSSITPLVGVGLIHVEKLIALTCGANIGTTVTGVLSALAGSNIVLGMQVAMVHVFFNGMGTVLWFMVWPLRAAPLSMAKSMGETAFQLKWFPLVYIIGCFGVAPLLVLGLCIAGWDVALIVLLPLVLVLIAFLVVAHFRRSNPKALPACLARDTYGGAEVPNWLRTDRDESKDAVDLDEMRAAEVVNRAFDNRTKWEYATLTWGLLIIAFLALVLALPTSQWRRVRYGVEPGRYEPGIGLFEVCSKSFGEAVKWAPPPAGDCSPSTIHTWLQEENASLLSSCAGDSSWASVDNWAPKKYAKDSDKYWKSWNSSKYQHETAWQYHDAWYLMRKKGCLAPEWRTACYDLKHHGCAGAQHKRYCEIGSIAWIWPLDRSRLSYANYDGTNEVTKDKVAWAAVTGDAADGAHCMAIGDWCPGPLKDDIRDVAGLAISGTLFLGLGMLLVCFFSCFRKATESLGFFNVIAAGSACVFLGWVLLFATWSQMYDLEKKTYSCPFVDETGRGAVMVTGALGDITMQSYSWAFAVFAWASATLALPFVAMKLLEEWKYLRGEPEVGQEEHPQQEDSGENPTKRAAAVDAPGKNTAPFE